MFASSFSLLYTLKDYNQFSGIGEDVNYYIMGFLTINDVSWSEIFYRFITKPNGNEPLYWLYVKIANLLFFGDGVIFTFFHYFFTFAIIAYLAKIIDTNKFVIIIVCILFLNFNVLTGIPLFRQTMSFLLFFIGIFLLDARKWKWLSRILIYSSVLVHISMVIIVIFYELFSLATVKGLKVGFSKLYSKEIVGYTVIIGLIFVFFINENYILFVAQYVGLYKFVSHYYLVLSPSTSYSSILFNWFTYLILLSLWFRRNKLANVDIFIVIQYFLINILLNELSVPDVFSRYTYFILLGGAILIGRMAVIDSKPGFILLIFIFIQFYYHLQFNPGFNGNLSVRMFTSYMDPFYGLGRIIFNYDTLLNFNLYFS